MLSGKSTFKWISRISNGTISGFTGAVPRGLRNRKILTAAYLGNYPINSHFFSCDMKLDGGEADSSEKMKIGPRIVEMWASEICKN